jgi:hypothetical protein
MTILLGDIPGVDAVRLARRPRERLHRDRAGHAVDVDGVVERLVVGQRGEAVRRARIAGVRRVTHVERGDGAARWAAGAARRRRARGGRETIYIPIRVSASAYLGGPHAAVEGGATTILSRR